MKHRMLACAMIIVIITIQLTPTPVYAERFKGDVIDWLFEMGKRNNIVAQGKYLRDKANQLTSGNTDLLDFADDLMQDYFNNSQYNYDSARDAISNTLFGLPPETQNNIMNVYNNYKNTDIILAPSVQAELNINAFNKAVLQKEVVDTTQRKPKSPPVTEVMTQQELTHLIDTNDIYEEKFDDMANLLITGKSHILSSSVAGKYIYFFQFQRADKLTKRMNGYDHEAFSNHR